MKVIIDGVIHNAHDKPIIVVLSDGDKKNISNMHPSMHKYIVYPDTITPDEASELIAKYQDVKPNK